MISLTNNPVARIIRGVCFLPFYCMNKIFGYLYNTIHKTALCIFHKIGFGNHKKNGFSTPVNLNFVDVTNKTDKIDSVAGKVLSPPPSSKVNATSHEDGEKTDQDFVDSQTKGSDNARTTNGLTTDSSSIVSTSSSFATPIVEGSASSPTKQVASDSQIVVSADSSISEVSQIFQPLQPVPSQIYSPPMEPKEHKGSNIFTPDGIIISSETQQKEPSIPTSPISKEVAAQSTLSNDSDRNSATKTPPQSALLATLPKTVSTITSPAPLSDSSINETEGEPKSVIPSTGTITKKTSTPPPLPTNRPHTITQKAQSTPQQKSKYDPVTIKIMRDLHSLFERTDEKPTVEAFALFMSQPNFIYNCIAQINQVVKNFDETIFAMYSQKPSPLHEKPSAAEIKKHKISSQFLSLYDPQNADVPKFNATQCITPFLESVISVTHKTNTTTEGRILLTYSQDQRAPVEAWVEKKNYHYKASIFLPKSIILHYVQTRETLCLDFEVLKKGKNGIEKKEYKIPCGVNPESIDENFSKYPGAPYLIKFALNKDKKNNEYIFPFKNIVFIKNNNNPQFKLYLPDPIPGYLSLDFLSEIIDTRLKWGQWE